MKAESDFIKVDKEKEIVTVSVNPSVFPIDLIYNATYMLMDRAYVILDGDPKEMVYVLLKPRKYKGDLLDLGRMLFDELVASAFHAVQFIRNKEMREALLQSIAPATEETDVSEEIADDSEDEEFDENDIATIWEEKFGGSHEGDFKKE